MKTQIIGAALIAFGLLAVGETQGGDWYQRGLYSGYQGCSGFAGPAGLPYFGYGFSGSLYGLGRVPVPPYFALHPPVYYSHEIRRRPIGDSPFAYPPQRPAPEPKRQFSLNPFIPDVLIEEDNSQQTAGDAETVARVIKNPFYDNDAELLAASGLINNPHYIETEIVVAQADNSPPAN